MTQTTNTAPAAQTNNAAPVVAKTPKPVSKWRYRIIIGLLILFIIALMGGSAYGGWYLWRQSEDRKTQVTKLEDEVEVLKRERNVSVEDLQAKVRNQESQISDLNAENKRVKDELTTAQNRINQLTPKNIRDVNYKQLRKINEAGGDVWLNPIYADVTGDGKEDAIYAYRLAGAGGFLNVYVYSYLDTNNLTEILKAEEYQKGTVTYLTEEKVVEIKSQTGTPDAPQVAVSRFKWDAATKKMIK